MRGIPFNSELIKIVPIFLFISTFRALISNRLHNAARQRGLTPNVLSRSSILSESIGVYFPRVHSPWSPRARRVTCIRFSISNVPARAGTPHNATSLIQGRQYIPESIDKTYNTRIRKLPLLRHANAPAFSDRCVSLLFHRKRVSICSVAHLLSKTISHNHNIKILSLWLIVLDISHNCICNELTIT